MVIHKKYCTRIEYKLLRTEYTHIHSMQSGICMIELSIESDSSKFYSFRLAKVEMKFSVSTGLSLNKRLKGMRNHLCNIW